MKYTQSDVSVIIPTIQGREHWLKQCVASYQKLSPGVEIVIVRDAPSCGSAWREGAARATKNYFHFTADDITPHARWWRSPIRFLAEGVMPAAFVYDSAGQPLMCDSPLGDLGTVPNILVPFLSRELLDLGGWFVDFHYGTDDWITYRARSLGYEVRRCPGYEVTHHVAPEGRNYMRRPGDVRDLADSMRQAGYLPPVYEQLEINLRSSKTGLDSVSLHQVTRRHEREARRAEARRSRLGR